MRRNVYGKLRPPGVSHLPNTSGVRSSGLITVSDAVRCCDVEAALAGEREGKNNAAAVDPGAVKVVRGWTWYVPEDLLKIGFIPLPSVVFHLCD